MSRRSWKKFKKSDVATGAEGWYLVMTNPSTKEQYVSWHIGILPMRNKYKVEWGGKNKKAGYKNFDNKEKARTFVDKFKRSK